MGVLDKFLDIMKLSDDEDYDDDFYDEYDDDFEEKPKKSFFKKNNKGKDVEDEELRNIDQVQIDLSKLSRYYDLKKDDIEKIVIYTHPSVKLLNIDDRFELKTI